MGDELLTDLPARSAELPEALRHGREVPGLSGADAVAGRLSLRRLLARSGLQPQAAADRGVSRLRPAAFDPRRHHLRADQE